MTRWLVRDGSCDAPTTAIVRAVPRISSGVLTLRDYPQPPGGRRACTDREVARERRRACNRLLQALGIARGRAVCPRRVRSCRAGRMRRWDAGRVEDLLAAPRGRAGGGRARALGRRRCGEAARARRRTARDAARAL